MKYHYKIVNKFNPTDVPVDSIYFLVGTDQMDCTDWLGWRSCCKAEEAGEKEIISGKWNPDQYYVVVYSPDKEKFVQKILDYCNSVEDDWDGYGGMKPTDKVKENVSYLLSELPDHILKAIDLFDGVTICPNGTVGFEWLVNSYKLWVEIGEESMTVLLRHNIDGVNHYDGKNKRPIEYTGILEDYFVFIGLKK